jgi:mono/diheme cytochrome c family protein
MRILRVVAVVLLALVVGVGITVGAMIQTSRNALERHYEIPPTELALPTDAASLEEGHRLYRAYGCIACHMEDGGGRVVMSEGPGYVVAPDITLVASAWPVHDLERLVRHGVRPSGTPVLLMPAHDYWYLDDAHTAALLAYVRSLPPAGRSYGPSSLTPLGHVLHALDAFPLVPAEHVQHYARRPPMGEPGTVELGRTLGHMCTGCHGEHLSGGAIPGTDPAVLGLPRNLTPDESGLAHWTEEQFRTALRTGEAPSGPLDNAHMPWRDSYQYFTDDELHSLWLWLGEQPPLAFGNR